MTLRLVHNDDGRYRCPKCGREIGNGYPGSVCYGRWPYAVHYMTRMRPAAVSKRSSDNYVKRKDLTGRDCGWPGPRSDGGWQYHCFRPLGHDGPHEAMAAEGESIPQTAAGTVRWR